MTARTATNGNPGSNEGRKLIIFGSTGRTGRHLVRQALSAGHAVTAFTRNQGNVRVTHENLTVVQGDVMDLKKVEDAMYGQDAVLCSLGGGRKGMIRSAGTRNIVLSMKKTGIRRLICQTSLGVGESRGNLNFFWKYVMFGLLLKEAYTDHERQEQHIMESHLQWTIVRPGAFTDGPRTGIYRHGFMATARVKLKISCADIADFMLKQLEDDSYLHKTPGLSY